MSYIDCNCFEKKLAFHTAPALLGLKPANIFSVSRNEFNEKDISDFNSRVECKGLKLRVMCKCQNKRLLIMYNERKLDIQLHITENAELLKLYGYSTGMTTEEMLSRLSDRIEKNDGFPHEIGIFLGYPIEDVYGFIENGGDNFKLCGYWKVYGDAEKARRIFNNYNKCRSFLCDKLNQGNDIYQALKIS